MCRATASGRGGDTMPWPAAFASASRRTQHRKNAPPGSLSACAAISARSARPKTSREMPSPSTLGRSSSTSTPTSWPSRTATSAIPPEWERLNRSSSHRALSEPRLAVRIGPERHLLWREPEVAAEDATERGPRRHPGHGPQAQPRGVLAFRTAERVECQLRSGADRAPPPRHPPAWWRRAPVPRPRTRGPGTPRSRGDPRPRGPGGAAHVAPPRQQHLALHHHAVRGHLGAFADVGAVEQYGAAAHVGARRRSCTGASFSTRSSKLCDCRWHDTVAPSPISSMSGSTDLQERAAEHHAASDAATHGAQPPRHERRALERQQDRHGVGGPHLEEDVPAAAPARPERVPALADRDRAPATWSAARGRTAARRAPPPTAGRVTRKNSGADWAARHAGTARNHAQRQRERHQRQHQSRGLEHHAREHPVPARVVRQSLAR